MFGDDATHKTETRWKRVVRRDHNFSDTAVWGDSF